MSQSSALYAAYQADNPEGTFNDDLIDWRLHDDTAGYLEDVFAALEVVPGITYRGVRVERDESRFPRELVYNDIEVSRLDLAEVDFHLALGEEEKDVTLSIFIPKLRDGLFYILSGSLYYPILQLVDRGTYVTRKTLTLKTLLMPLVFRRDAHMDVTDIGAEPADGTEAVDGVWPEAATHYPSGPEAILTLDLFRSRINVLKYMLAAKGLTGALEFLGAGEGIGLYQARDIVREPRGFWRAHPVAGPAGLVAAAPVAWIAEDPAYRSSLLATVADALAGVPLRAVTEDDRTIWLRRLGKHFTQNSNGYEEKAERILVSLERILDRRTRRNLAHVRAEDKADVYSILRWMMRDFRALTQVDGMDVRNKRIRVSEYLIHPLLLRFSESTYRLLNSKNLTFRALGAIFRPFVREAEGRARPQAGFLIRRIQTNELLRYSNMVNSFDLLTALRYTSRGPSTPGDRGRGDISLRFRGHHPSYVGRISLASASASDPGVSGLITPFCRIAGQFFL